MITCDEKKNKCCPLTKYTMKIEVSRPSPSPCCTSMHFPVVSIFSVAHRSLRNPISFVFTFFDSVLRVIIIVTDPTLGRFVSPAASDELD